MCLIKENCSICWRVLPSVLHGFPCLQHWPQHKSQIYFNPNQMVHGKIPPLIFLYVLFLLETPGLMWGAFQTDGRCSSDVSTRLTGSGVRVPSSGQGGGWGGWRVGLTRRQHTLHKDGSVNRVVLGQANLALQNVGRRPTFFTPWLSPTEAAGTCVTLHREKWQCRT